MDQEVGPSVCVSGPKNYFINALALNDHFKGEIELTDNFIHVDYYQLYYADNEKRLLIFDKSSGWTIFEPLLG